MNKDFDDIFKQVQEQVPDIKMRHGGMEPPKKPRARIHPMVKLTNYIEKNNLRLVDFFNKFDKDGSMSVTYEEFQQGIEVKPTVGLDGHSSVFFLRKSGILSMVVRKVVLFLFYKIIYFLGFFWLQGNVFGNF